MKQTLADRRNLRRYTGDDTIRTPSAIYHQLDREFHFTMDVAADADNHLAPAWFDERKDGLMQDWAPRTVFCNPPYSNIGPWIRKALRESKRGATCVLLLPVRTDLAWFHECALEGEVRFIRGRLQFENTPRRGSAPHASMLVIFRPGGA